MGTTREQAQTIPQQRRVAIPEPGAVEQQMRLNRFLARCGIAVGIADGTSHAVAWIGGTCCSLNGAEASAFVVAVQNIGPLVPSPGRSRQGTGCLHRAIEPRLAPFPSRDDVSLGLAPDQIHRPGRLAQTAQGVAIHQIDVQPAVGVEVDKGATCTYGLE